MLSVGPTQWQTPADKSSLRKCTTKEKLAKNGGVEGCCWDMDGSYKSYYILAFPQLVRLAFVRFHLQQLLLHFNKYAI